MDDSSSSDVDTERSPMRPVYPRIFNHDPTLFLLHTVTKAITLWLRAEAYARPHVFFLRIQSYLWAPDLSPI